MKKLLCIIAVAAMALVAASSTAIAETKKRPLSDKATHRMKSPRSVPAPLRQWPPNNPTFREYEELKRQGWYKEDKA
jgi:maltose-binding protein MalE